MTADDRIVRPTGSDAPPAPLTGALVTAAAALVVGILVLVRGTLASVDGATDYSSLAWAGVVLAAITAILVAVASYDWPAPTTGQDKWRRIRAIFGAQGTAARLVGALGWVAAAVVAVVTATIALPQLIPGWPADAVFFLGLLVVTLLALVGWGPTAGRAWPTGFRLSSLTFVGSAVALALVAAYLFFIYVLIGEVDVEAEDWARLVELRSTLEALAFAAAGALIGKTVSESATSSQLKEQRGEIAEKEQIVQEQHGEIAEKEQSVEERDALLADKNSKVAGAINLLTDPGLNVDSGSFQLYGRNGLRLIREDPHVADADSVRRARSLLIDALASGTSPPAGTRRGR